MGGIRNIGVIFRRELHSYFTTPIAYVVIIIFLVMASVFTFYEGALFERGEADLLPFFESHPWMYLFLVPALAMRLWAEERKSGTLELLLTLPVTLFQAVLGKFIAAWVFCGIALGLTFPVWLTVSYLGNPDHGAILTGYLGSWLMAGGFLAIGSCVSAMTKNQVIAFVIAVTMCFAFTFSGYQVVLNLLPSWLPDGLVELIASLSFKTHFDSLARGVLDIRDIVFFIVMIVAWLLATAVVVDMKKAG